MSWVSCTPFKFYCHCMHPCSRKTRSDRIWESSSLICYFLADEEDDPNIDSSSEDSPLVAISSITAGGIIMGFVAAFVAYRLCRNRRNAEEPFFGEISFFLLSSVINSQQWKTKLLLSSDEFTSKDSVSGYRLSCEDFRTVMWALGQKRKYQSRPYIDLHTFYVRPRPHLHRSNLKRSFISEFAFQCERKTLRKRSFRKRWRHDNHAISLAELKLSENAILKCLRCSMDRA